MAAGAPVSDRTPQGIPEVLVAVAQNNIQEKHVTHVKWHTALNNHASTRPDVHGGKLVNSVT